MPWKSRVTFNDDNDRLVLHGKKGGRLTMRRSPMPGVVELYIENTLLNGDVMPILIDSRDIQSAAISITANGKMED
jgi:hypothetical protein